MSAGEIAGLVAAGAFVLLVALLALPLLKLTTAIEETRRSIERLTDEALPTLREATESMRSVNASLAQAEGITADVHTVSSNVSGLAAVVTSAVAAPLVKANALSYGVTRALAQRRAAGAPRLRGLAGDVRAGMAEREAALAQTLGLERARAARAAAPAARPAAALDPVAPTGATAVRPSTGDR